MNLRGHADVFVPEFYGFGTVHQLPPERAARLESGEDHVTLFAPEIVLEVMPDTPAVAHAAAGDDDGPGAHAVDGHGLRGGAAEMEVGHGEGIAVLLAPPRGLGVEQFPVPGIDLGGLDCHRAVEKDRPVIDAPFPAVMLEKVDQLLAAADSEGRDENIAFAAPRLAKHLAQLRQRVFPGAVLAVAVGAFEDDQIRLAHDLGIAQDRRARVPQIAADHQLAPLALFLEPEFHDRRTEDMSRVLKAQLHARQDFFLDIIVEHLKLAHGLLGVAARVQRFDEALALALTPAVLVFRVLLVQRSRVLEHDVAQVARRAVGVDRPAVTGLDQQRQAAGVIEVGMCQDHGVDIAGCEGERRAVARLVGGRALDQAAVDEQAAVATVHQVARTGDFARRAQKLDIHAATYNEWRLGPTAAIMT